MTTKNTGMRVLGMALLLALSGCELPMLGCIGCANNSPDTRAFLSAAERGDLAAVRSMLESGTRVNASNDKDETALLLASRSGHDEVVALLLEKRADVNAASGEYDQGSWVQVNGQQQYQREFHLYSTPLQEAAKEGHTAIMRMLLKHGARTNTDNQYGQTALKLAARRGDYEQVQLLLAAGADVNHGAPFFGTTARSDTALMFAVGGACRALRDAPAQAEAYRNVVQLLLKAHARTDIKDEGGRTAYFQSLDCPASGVAQMLTQGGPSVDAKDNAGRSALSLAAQKGDLATLRYLLDNRADPNTADGNRRTPLLYAAAGKHHDAVDALVKAGANVNVADTQGKTPLMMAVEQDDLGAVELLLAHGADLNAQSELGLTALQFARLARGSNAAAILKRLERAGARE